MCKYFRYHNIFNTRLNKNYYPKQQTTPLHIVLNRILAFVQLCPCPFLSLAVPVLSLVVPVLSLAVPVLSLAVTVLSLAAPLLSLCKCFVGQDYSDAALCSISLAMDQRRFGADQHGYNDKCDIYLHR